MQSKTWCSVANRLRLKSVLKIFEWKSVTLVKNANISVEVIQAWFVSNLDAWQLYWEPFEDMNFLDILI